nr:MAG: hypothetical protein [Bacteriophage sp.]
MVLVLFRPAFCLYEFQELSVVLADVLPFVRRLALRCRHNCIILLVGFFHAFPSQSLGRISVLEVVLDEVGHVLCAGDALLVVLHPFVELFWHFLHLPCELPMAHVLSVHDCGGVCVHLLLAGEDGNCITAAPWMPSCELEVLWKAFSVE